MANHKVTIRYGELDLEVHVYVEPPEPEIGIRSPQVDIEEIHMARSYYNREGVELDTGFEDFIYDRYERDQQFAMTLHELVLKALEDGARQAREDVDHYPRVARLSGYPVVCTRPCIDRVDPWAAHQDSAGPLARKAG